MSDREMLGLAAKAAGYTVNAQRQAERDALGFGDAGLWIDSVSTCWNPRDDDGAALRLAEEAGRRARIAHAQEVRTDLARIEKWRGLALARDGDGRTVEAVREEAMGEERRACLAIVRAPHFKPAVRNELARRASLIEDRGAR